MAEIKLTKGYVAIVDDEDFERVNAHRWCANVQYRVDGKVRSVYAKRAVAGTTTRQRTERLHRFILGLTDPKIHTDHINGNGLDNRRANLRPCTRSQNMANRRVHSNSSTGIKGVQREGKKWKAQIHYGSTVAYLGMFDTAEEASQAYARAARLHFGEFACISEEQR